MEEMEVHVAADEIVDAKGLFIVVEEFIDEVNLTSQFSCINLKKLFLFNAIFFQKFRIE